MNLGGALHLNKTGIIFICGFIIILLLYSSSSKKSQNDLKKQNLIDIRKLLEIAINAAEYGGKKVVETKDDMKVKIKGLTKEGLQDSVTTADFLSHCAMTNIFKKYFNDLKIISEENHNCDKSDLPNLTSQIVNLPEEYIDIQDVTVWIDPLDATHEYTEKSPTLYKYITTMVCVAVKGKPIIGVIHKPFNKITSWAWVGKEMSKDLQQNNNILEENDEAKIIISRSHKGQIEDILKQNFKDKFSVVIAAGAGYKALEVAYGNVNAYMHSTVIKKWDICAGNAIINAKGGHMTTKLNKIIDYSDTSSVKNEDGLIATLKNHEKYVGIL